MNHFLWVVSQPVLIRGVTEQHIWGSLRLLTWLFQIIQRHIYLVSSRHTSETFWTVEKKEKKGLMQLYETSHCSLLPPPLGSITTRSELKRISCSWKDPTHVTLLGLRHTSAVEPSGQSAVPRCDFDDLFSSRVATDVVNNFQPQERSSASNVDRRKP